MRKTTRLAVASLVTLPLAACGAAVPAPGVSRQDAPRRLAEAICATAYRCCTAAELMGNKQAGTDEASCESMTEAAITQQVAGIDASEKKGRVTYDGLKVQGCLDYLQPPAGAPPACTELDMTNHLSGVPACASFLQPKVAPGGACSADFECEGGFCDETGVAAGADGACRAFGAVGASCANMGRCEPGASCDATDMTCRMSPTGAGPPPAGMCFYSSACSYAGGDAGAGSAFAVGLLTALVASRRRRRADGRQCDDRTR
jgi:uncharacterized protein (TIGR03382 family)